MRNTYSTKKDAIKVRLSAASAVCCIAVAALTGCSQKQVEVTISDRQTKTVFTAPAGYTVEKLLSKAEIVLENGDEISPSLDSKMTEGRADIAISRHVKVQLIADGKKIPLEMTGGTVGDALKQAGFILTEQDFVNHDLNAYLTDGMIISVVHRLGITLVADGKTLDLLTEADTVEAFLEEQRIVVGAHDRIRPALSSRLEDGVKVSIKRVKIKEETRTEAIAYDTERIYSSQMPAGTTKVTRAGSAGKKVVTYEVTYVDGKEESRKKIKEEIIAKAVNQVVVQGTKKGGKTVVSKKRVEDCDGSGHGYYIITYSDGTVEYQDY